MMPSYILPTLPRYLQLYYYFRSLRLPLRRRFFAGQDLSGNTYWEVHREGEGEGEGEGRAGERRRGSRPRRMVSFCGNMREKMAEGVQSPQWSQWLRGLRGEAPSVEELLLDERRRAVIQARVRVQKEEEEEENRASLKLAQEGSGGGRSRSRRRLLGSVGVVGERLNNRDSDSDSAAAAAAAAEAPVTVEKVQPRVHPADGGSSRAPDQKKNQDQQHQQHQDPWETARTATTTNEADQAPAAWSPTPVKR